MFSLSANEWIAIGLCLRIASVATLVSLPFGVATALLLARGRFRQEPARRVRSPATGFATGRHRLCSASAVWASWPHRLFVGADGDCPGVSLDWRGSRRGCHGFPPDGARYPPLDRGYRPAARSRSRQPRGQPAWTFLLVTLPLAAPGILVGAILAFAKALGEFGATITFVSNIPGETQTISAAMYSL